MKKHSYSIIGAESYLGQHFSKFLLDKCHVLNKYDITSGVDRSTRVVDVTQIDSLEHIDFNVDYILVFAGLTGTAVGFEKYDDFINVNEKGLINILTKYREKKSNAQIIFPSSRLVYKGQNDKPLKEEDPNDFKTIYALNKFVCEQLLKLYAEYFGIKYTTFRICVPYGNLMNSGLSFGTMGHFFSKATKREPLVIFGDGEQKRSFIHIEDLVNIVYLAMLNSSSINQIYNIGGAETYTIREVAELIAKKYAVNVLYEPWPEIALKIESGDTIFDSSKVERLTNYKYQYNFKDWIGTL